MAGEKSILIDSSLCIGCYTCYTACKAWQSLPQSGGAKKTRGNRDTIIDIRPQNWLTIHHQESASSYSMRPEMCRHCTDALCIQQCPVKAIRHVDGWVVIDHQVCIGCGACAMVCPYKSVVIYRGDTNGTLIKNKSYKCDGCTDNFSKTPQCVKNCPSGALVYDYRVKLINRAKKRIKDLRLKFPEVHVVGVLENSGNNIIVLETIKKSHQQQSRDTQNNSGISSVFKVITIFTGKSSLFSGKLYRALHLLVTGQKLG